MKRREFHDHQTLRQPISASLPPRSPVPNYDQSGLKAGIVHFGVGNFHRSHQAVYLDDLFNAGVDHDWALVGAGVFEGEKIGRDKLEAQDWLTTVVEQDSRPYGARVTGAMIDFLVPGDTAAIIARACRSGHPHRLADHHRGRLFHRPGLRRSSTRRIPTSSPTPPTSRQPEDRFGLILAGLKRRRADGIAPFTVMSCDNIPHNGHVTADAVVGLAQLVRSRPWRTGCSENVAFPNGMVDRITPATTDRERDHPEATISASTTIGRSSANPSSNGCWRTISRRPPGAGKGRRAVRRGRRALRTDEDPHPQWRPRDDRLSGRADGHPFRP